MIKVAAFWVSLAGSQRLLGVPELPELDELDDEEELDELDDEEELDELDDEEELDELEEEVPDELERPPLVLPLLTSGSLLPAVIGASSSPMGEWAHANASRATEATRAMRRMHGTVTHFSANVRSLERTSPRILKVARLSRYDNVVQKRIFSAAPPGEPETATLVDGRETRYSTTPPASNAPPAMNEIVEIVDHCVASSLGPCACGSHPLG
jgi:hypothetical protein